MNPQYFGQNSSIEQVFESFDALSKVNTTMLNI